VTEQDGDRPLYPPLRAEHADFHLCLTCGAVLVAKTIQFHDDWHNNISSAAIEALDGARR
jgi:hypothetical protein